MQKVVCIIPPFNSFPFFRLTLLVLRLLLPGREPFALEVYGVRISAGMQCASHLKKIKMNTNYRMKVTLLHRIIPHCKAVHNIDVMHLQNPDNLINLICHLKF